MDVEFAKHLKKEKKKIDLLIQNFYKKAIELEEEPFLREFLTYGSQFVIQGGRRLHPISLIETFKGISSERNILDNAEQIYQVSIAIELMHISNLMLDDLIDQEEFRRGKKTFHRFMGEKFTKKHNNGENYETASAIYGGNLTSIFGSKIITDSKFDHKRKSKALQVYLSGLAGVTRSNLLDEYYKREISLDKITLENYLILADKRAKQMETAVALGAIFGNARKSQMKPLMEAMNKVGIVEQIQNDINGTFGDPKLHSIDHDIKSGQSTILTIISYQNANQEQKTQLNEILGNPKATNDQLQVVREIYQTTGATNFAEMYSKSLINEVYNSLKQIYPGLRNDSMAFYGQLLTYITNS
ncbi:Geranylfarnesyl diphosphate synthase [Candidatus Lokiarchaeum ossiferum]|uniref:Geranylfarnesyl diphosphate synthase n=1 Tax=Candidatus Lokiarchaeum ossiferum TaxID=2951803 RepID=A0ABY6HVQ8_9ARCH|nr:Geranylfarnesyl diphosphate synthase [Candidatus Lokiarchaeum sp. B-35]